MTIQDAAREALRYFTTTERGEDTILTLRGDVPEWVRELVYTAHADFGPDDWRYATIYAALNHVADSHREDDMDDGHEFADDAVDIYTTNRLAWLASNLNRARYCDEAAVEFGDSKAGDIIAQIGCGQYAEAYEVYELVIAALASHIQ